MKVPTSKALLLSALALTLFCLMAGLQPINPLFEKPPAEAPQAIDRITPLIGGRWRAEGKWANGDPFNQEQVYEWGAGRKYVRSRTYVPGADERSPTLRSEGVRTFSKPDGKTLFWEFDGFGGITTGEIRLESASTFFYEYRYPVGGRVRTIRDHWTRIDDDHYAYKSGAYEDGRWQEMFLEGTITRSPAPATCPHCGHAVEAGE